MSDLSFHDKGSRPLVKGADVAIRTQHTMMTRVSEGDEVKEK